MTQYVIPYTFQNQTTADASQVDQNFSAIQSVVNGNIDDGNIKPGSITQSIATEGVTPSQTKGIPYAADLFAGSFVMSGLSVTKDGTNANQVDVTSGVVYIKQSDNSLRRFNVAATNFRTALNNYTYYLDFNPDGTWSWNTAHSTQSNYLNVATVTSDASANVSTVTQNTSVDFGVFVAGVFAPSGAIGAQAASRYVGATTSGAPTSGTFAVGDFIIDRTNGCFWICTVAGTPGTWTKQSGMSVVSGGNKIQSGSASFGAGLNVTFPTAFATVPIVVVTGIGSVSATFSAGSVTTTSFNANAYQGGGYTTGTGNWIAIGT